MKRIDIASRITLVVAVAWGTFTASPAAAQVVLSDVVTVGSASGSPGSTVNVPVYIRDTAGTPLGIDQPSGSRIQSYSITVDYAPTTSVQTVTFTRAGITAPLTPTFESSPSTTGAISLIDQFAEMTNLIPFNSNAALPGNLVGHLLVTIPASAVPGSTINLTLDPLTTELTDAGGTPATAETPANGRLTLVAGAIAITASAGNVPTLGTWALLFLAAALAFVAVRVRM